MTNVSPPGETCRFSVNLHWLRWTESFLILRRNICQNYQRSLLAAKTRYRRIKRSLISEQILLYFLTCCAILMSDSPLAADASTPIPIPFLIALNNYKERSDRRLRQLHESELRRTLCKQNLCSRTNGDAQDVQYYCLHSESRLQEERRTEISVNTAGETL